ncbi:DUF1579 domain-containing protein [bacterium]|nr:DUF1579 domain-containing protein [bacterium]
MKARWIALPAVLGAFCAATGAAAQEGGAAYDEAMQEWMKYMMPGEPHEALQYYAGDWTFVNTMDMEGQQMTSEGTAHVEMMLGGRYLHAVNSSTMMGMPFEGVGITGYDNVDQEYFNVWFDNMGTGVMVSWGKADADGNIVVNGEMTDPMKGKIHFRMISRITGPDTYTYEMFEVKPEGDHRVMEILYTRVKS